MGPFKRGMILLGIICIVIISVSAASAPDSTPNQAATTGTGINVINKVWVGPDPVNEAKSGETYIQTISDTQADTKVGASCKKDFYTITPSAGPHGTITPSNRVAVRRGSSKTFLITPDRGFIIKDVLVDGTSVGPVTSYTFSEVQDDHRISATFEKAFLTIIPDTGHHGTISPSSPVTVPRGGSQTFTITPDSGYAIKDVLVDRTSIGPVPSYTFTDVQDNHKIKATFEKALFTITPSAGSHGQISPSVPVTVPRGGSQIFSITSDPGYRIKDVVVDGKSVGPVPSYTFTNVHDDHKIKATFKQTKLTFTITPSAGPDGTITPPTAVTVPYAGSQTFTITPYSGYVVDQVLVNGGDVGSITSYTFTNVQADQTISATFKQTIVTFTITSSAGSNGAIAPPGPVPVPYAGSQTFTITPESGYVVDQVLVNGENVGSITSYTFTNVQADQTISATFKQTIVTFTITSSAGSNGAIAPPGPVTVPYAGSQTFTITPESGYVVDQVLVNGEPVGSITSYTFTDVQTDQTISATFKPGTINCFGDRIDNGYDPTYTIYVPFGDPLLPQADRDAHVWQWNSERCSLAYAEVSPDYAHPGTADYGMRIACEKAIGDKFGYGYTQIMQGGAYASPVWGVNLPQGTTISFWYKTIMTGSSASYDGAQVEYYPSSTIVPLATATTTDWKFIELSAPAGGPPLEVIFSVAAGNGHTSELWLSNIYAECSATSISSSASMSSVQSRMVKSTMVQSTSEVSPLSWTNVTGTEQAPGTNTG